MIRGTKVNTNAKVRIQSTAMQISCDARTDNRHVATAYNSTVEFKPRRGMRRLSVCTEKANVKGHVRFRSLTHPPFRIGLVTSAMTPHIQRERVMHMHIRPKRIMYRNSGDDAVMNLLFRYQRTKAVTSKTETASKPARQGRTTIQGPSRPM